VLCLGTVGERVVPRLLRMLSWPVWDQYYYTYKLFFCTPSEHYYLSLASMGVSRHLNVSRCIHIM
jgi:hypothetical protein